MARVRPFQAWRYASDTTDISTLTAPPYDVISEVEREAFVACDPHNVVSLELPEGPLDQEAPGNRYDTGAHTWDLWRRTGVLMHDPAPCLYLLEQRYSLEGREIRRRAIVVEVGLEPFDAGVILPHERTLPKALGDRFELIKATAANLSQVFGLFEDRAGASDAIFEAIVSEAPIETATDAEGVVSTLWRSCDAGLIDALSRLMAEKNIFIADGHHRYTTALAYRNLRRSMAKSEGSQPADPAYDYVMMALVNMDDPDLVVLPTHRAVTAEGPFDPGAFFDSLTAWFDLTELAEETAFDALAEQARPSFVIKTRDGDTRLGVLRDDVDLDRTIDLPHSSAWKHLDVAVLQELILDPMLGIHPDRPDTLDRLSFIKDAHVALASADRYDATFILRPTRLDQLREVALAGETMPQKSTYFHPKLLSGMLFRSAE